MRYVCWILWLSPIAFAAACPANQPRTEAALVQIEQTWARSLEHSDATALGCILAQEFEDAGPDGSLTDRAATLAKAAQPRQVHHELAEFQAHVHDDFGYIRGLATTTDPQGKVLARVRFTDVYVYRDGRWECVAGHESMLGK